MTVSQMSERIEYAKTCIVKGWKDSKIASTISEKYGVTDRTGRSDISKARQSFSDDLIAIRPFEFAQTKARLEAIYERAIVLSDLRLALDTLKEMSKLLDLYPATKHQHTWQHEIVGLVNAGVVTVEQVKEEFGDDLARELFSNVLLDAGR